MAVNISANYSTPSTVGYLSLPGILTISEYLLGVLDAATGILSSFYTA